MSNNMNNISSIDASQTDIAYVKTPVVVNLRAAISASATVSVFGPSDESVSNVIWCDLSMNHQVLYQDSSNAMFEFWEPADACGNLLARVAKAGSGADVDRDAAGRATAFNTALAGVLKGGLDASAANPFRTYTEGGYTHYATFGELALAYAAEGMFGHPSATAAITNDAAIVDGFNTNSATVPSSGAVTRTQANQALAQRLAAALYGSGDDVATAIAQVVLGQDARRARNEDNSTLQVDHHSALRFHPGDVVYVKITLAGFTPTIGPQASYLGQQYTPAQPKAQEYFIRINLY